MKHPERIDDYLEPIAEAVQRAISYIKDFDNADAFRHDTRTQDAVIRNIEIMGEAANHIQNTSPAFVVSHPELPWIEMRGIRNKMIREYFDMDSDTVFATVKDYFLDLSNKLKACCLLAGGRGTSNKKKDRGESLWCLAKGKIRDGILINKNKGL